MASVSPGGTTLHGLVEAAAQRWPEAEAVVYDDGTRVQLVMYGDVLSTSNQVCDRLRQAGVSQEVVAVSLGAGPHIPTVLTGVMKVPAAFFPVSLHVGGATLSTTFTRLKVRVALIDTTQVETLRALLSPPLSVEQWDDLGLAVVWLGPTRGQCDWGNPLAYVITTSGSTGIPKVVRVPHDCIVPNVTHISALYQLTPRDLSVLMSPLTFDPGVVEVFAALTSGARLLLVPDVIKMVPSLFSDVITKHDVTVMQVTPSVAWSLGLLPCPRPPSLRVLSLGGEPCPRPGTLRAFRRHGHRVTLVNLYGVTEVSSWALYHVITDEDLSSSEEIPLGVPLKDTDYEVRDDHGAKVTEGEGQLYVGSPSRICYIDDAVHAPADGLRATGDQVRIDREGRLWYRGRTDRQVKRHGKRLDLDGLERVAMEMSGVCRCTAVFSDRHQGALHLVLQPAPQTGHIGQAAQLTGHIGQPQTPRTVGSSISAQGLRVENALEAEVRRHLHQRLPAQYGPDMVWVVDSLPYTRHGKVDQGCLREMISDFNNRSTERVMEINRKTVLEQLWKACLRLPPDHTPADTDRLLASGGDSFTAVRLLNELTQRLGDLDSLLLEVILTKTYRDVLDIVEGRAGGGDSEKTDRGLKQLATNTREHDVHTPNIDISQGPKRPSSSLVLSDEQAAKRPALTSKAPDICNSSLVSKGQNSQRETQKLQNGPNEAECSSIQQLEGLKPQSRDSPRPISQQAQREILSVGVGPAILAKPNPDPPLCSVALSRTNRIIPLCHHENRGQCAVSMETRSEVTGGGKDGNVRCSKPWLGLRIEWSWDTGKCIDASPLLLIQGSTGIAFIGSHSHKFVAVSMETGRVLWETVLGDRVESSACVTLSGDCVVVGCYDGLVYILDITSGDVVWTFPTRGQVKSSPCADPRTRLVYVGSHDHHLYALSVETQTCRWCRDLGAGSVYSSPTTAQSPLLVYVGTLGGQLVALQSLTGEVSWQRSVGRPIFSSPCLIPHGVVVGCVDGFVYAFSHQGGKMWTVETSGPVFSSPSYVDFPHTSGPRIDFTADVTPGSHSVGEPPSGRLVCGSHDKFVYCVNLHGHVVWCFEAGSEVFASPWIITDLTWNSQVRSTGLGTSILKSTPTHSDVLKMTTGPVVTGEGSCHPIEGSDQDVFSQTTKRPVTSTPCEPQVIAEDQESTPGHEPNTAFKVGVNTRELSDTIPKSVDLQLGVPKETGNTQPRRPNPVACQSYGSVVVVCTTKGRVCVLKMSDGQVLAECMLDGQVFSSPVVYGDSVYVGCRDNKLYRLRLTTR